MKTARLALNDGHIKTVVTLTEAHLAVLLGGRVWIAHIAAINCLGDRVRPLLKCPRAHEGNFQSLYYWGGELACRHCHRLRYRSNLAATATDRARLAKLKLLKTMGGRPGDVMPARRPLVWRLRYRRMAARLASLTGIHYTGIREWLGRQDP